MQDEHIMEIQQDLSRSLELRCQHCHTSIPCFDNVYNDKEGRSFCCAGCRIVFATIKECNLGDYYKIRDSLLSQPTAADVEQESFNYLDSPEILKEFLKEETLMHFFVKGIQCAACVWILEKIPQISRGILDVRIDGLSGTAAVRIRSDGKFSEFALMAQRLGYRVKPITLEENLEVIQEQNKLTELKRIGVAAVGAGNIMLLATADYLGAEKEFVRLFSLVSLILIVPVFIFSAWPIIKGAIASIRARVPSLDVPLAVALFAGFVLSVFSLFRGESKIYFDTLSVLVFLILSSRYFVNRLQEKFLTLRGDTSFLIPPYARKVGELSQPVMAAVRSLATGDRVFIEAGETLPVDGAVVSGSLWLNESVLTGEALPRLAAANSSVFAGTRAIDGQAEVEVISPGQASRVGRLALSSLRQAVLKGNFTRDLEVWSQRFTYIVLVLALATFLYFINSPIIGLERSLALLIVACPCAMAFGAPLVMAIAMNKAYKKGVVIRSADVFERVKKIKNVVFDKTGTLTVGDLSFAIDGGSQISKKDRSAIVAIESKSRHPIAKAIVNKWGSGLGVIPEVVDFEVIPGVGVRGTVAGETYELLTKKSGYELQGFDQLKFVIEVYKNKSLLFELEFHDQVRAEASSVVQSLKNKKLSLSIFSGDRKPSVQKIAHRVSIENTFAEMTPEQKEKKIEQMQNAMMVGDGINDAGAMSKASVGVAVGGAMERALKVSDVFLLQEGIKNIPMLWTLGDRSDRAIGSIRVFSILYNALTASLAMAGYVSPLMAAILMPVSSISVLSISFLKMREKK